MSAGAHHVDRLRDFLLGAPDAAPSVEDLRSATLSPLAHARLPSHPDAHVLQADFAMQTARHMLLKFQLAELLAELAQHGADVLVFKGFHMAEFVYPSPGLRPYADVDLLMREANLPALLEAAAATDWTVLWHLGEPDSPTALRSSEYLGHELAQLEHRTLGVTIDVHLRPVHNLHNRLPSDRFREKLADALWAGSQPSDVNGVPVRVPSPADAVVFGLALNRSWGSDEWWVKPRDYADLEALIQRTGLKREEIVARGAELGVRRTVAAYLDRCDPYRAVLNLGRPSWFQRALLDLRVSRERGSKQLVALRLAVTDLPREARDLVGSFRALGLANRLFRDRGTLATVDSAAVRPAGRAAADRPLTSSEWRSLVRGMNRAMRRSGTSRGNGLSTATLAAYLILRGRGISVELLRRGRELAIIYDGRRLPLDIAPNPERHPATVRNGAVGLEVVGSSAWR